MKKMIAAVLILLATLGFTAPAQAHEPDASRDTMKIFTPAGRMIALYETDNTVHVYWDEGDIEHPWRQVVETWMSGWMWRHPDVTDQTRVKYTITCHKNWAEQVVSKPIRTYGTSYSNDQNYFYARNGVNVSGEIRDSRCSVVKVVTTIGVRGVSGAWYNTSVENYYRVND